MAWHLAYGVRTRYQPVHTEVVHYSRVTIRIWHGNPFPRFLVVSLLVPCGQRCNDSHMVGMLSGLWTRNINLEELHVVGKPPRKCGNHRFISIYQRNGLEHRKQE